MKSSMQAGAVFFSLLLIVQQLVAQDAPKTTVSGFVDVYYAACFAAPNTRDRSFTTQPLRHNEFNLNLGVVSVQHQAEGFRGRFALQTGTYVESNLAAEPELLKHILEASVGTRFGDRVWVDLGIFPSHIGFEGILLKDNWNYSRSLLADYSPYYESGLSISVTLAEGLLVRGLLLNGWQNIGETNDAKAFGMQVQYAPSGMLLNWSTFVGNEAPDTSSSRLRIFNDCYVMLQISNALSVTGIFDVGVQRRDAGRVYDSWHAGALLCRYVLDSHWAFGGRVEYYYDSRGVIIATGTPNNFQTVAASLNVDYAPFPDVVWRAEVRTFQSRDEIYPRRGTPSKADGFVVVSAAITL
jgi:hypothetical protein